MVSNNKSIYSIIYNKLGSAKAEKLLMELNKILAYSSINELKKALKKLNTPFFPVVEQQRRNAILIINYLCSHFDLDLVDFELKFEQVIPKETNAGLSHLSKFLYVGDNKSLNNFHSKYNDELIPYVNILEKRLWVYNYMTYHYFELSRFEKYEESIGLIFKAIERKIGLDNFSYVRVLALPIHVKLSDEEIWQEAIIQMPFSMFTHIWRCYKDHRHIFGKSDLSKGFFITKKPRRRYQFGLLDDYIFTQHYRFDGSRNIFPEFIFVEHKTDQIQELYDTYHRHFQSKYIKHDLKLTLTAKQFAKLTLMALDLVNEDLEKETFIQTSHYKRTVRFDRYTVHHKNDLIKKVQHLDFDPV